MFEAINNYSLYNRKETIEWIELLEGEKTCNARQPRKTYGLQFKFYKIKNIILFISLNISYELLKQPKGFCKEKGLCCKQHKSLYSFK